MSLVIINPVDWGKTDLLTCVELNHTVPDPIAQPNPPVLTAAYHFLYASQLYGTLFGIYAKFDFDRNTRIVSGVELQLLNYEGVTNIGFYGQEVPHDEQPKPISGLPQVCFGVQAGSNNSAIKIDITETDGTSLKLSPAVHRRVKFCRVLFPMDGYAADAGGDVNRSSDIPKGKVNFDSEFHYRRGTDYFPQPLRPGMVGYRDPIKMASPRCHESNVNLVYF